MDTSEYNFKRCKLCGVIAAEPTYDLGNRIVYSCQNCDFNFLNHLDKINKSSGSPGSGLQDSKLTSPLSGLTPFSPITTAKF